MTQKHRIATLMILIVAAIWIVLGLPTEVAPRPSDTIVTVPEGFEVTIFHPGVGAARHLTARDNGDLYVRLRRGERGSIAALRDTNGDLKADRIEYFEERPGTGIGIHKNYLYYSTNTEVYRRKLSPGELVPSSEPELIVSGLPYGGNHPAKAITFDKAGFLYVVSGAPSNACQERTRSRGSKGLKPCPQLERHGGIWRFRADKLNQDQQRDGYRFATGMRQVVALAWNPTTEALYLVQHGRDQLDSLFPEHFTAEQNAELPAEEFHRIEDGCDLGWPYTYYDSLIGARMVAPEYGGDGKTKSKSDEYQEPLVAFPAHWAPNALTFYTAEQFPIRYQGGALVAFHGSWNRAPLPQQGYKVAFVPFTNGQFSSSFEVFADGFAGSPRISSSGEARFRPMGLAVGPLGNLFIVDSKEGRIWMVRNKTN